jgi:hypothetical protein
VRRAKDERALRGPGAARPPTAGSAWAQSGSRVSDVAWCNGWVFLSAPRARAICCSPSEAVAHRCAFKSSKTVFFDGLYPFPCLSCGFQLYYTMVDLNLILFKNVLEFLNTFLKLLRSMYSKFYQGDRVVKYIFIMCRVSAKTEFRRWRPHATLG